MEPDKRCYECCERTCRDLRLGNVDIVNAALADRDGDGLLSPCTTHMEDSRIYDPGDDNRLSGTPVQLISFESLVSQHHVNTERMFIKLDAQGAEPQIVRGMEHSLSRASDVILYTEIQQAPLVAAGCSIDAYLASLGRLGFVPVDLFNGHIETSYGDVVDSCAVAKDYCFQLSKANLDVRGSGR